MKTIEIHHDWYEDIPNMQTLILGTFPPRKCRWSYEFYYPNNKNLFWKTMAQVAGTSLKALAGDLAVNERKSLMKKLRVGVQNLGYKIEREDGSASDNKIKILEFHDILHIIRNAKYLQKILLTGYSGKTSTYKDFVNYLQKNNIPVIPPLKIIAGASFPIDVLGKKIDVFIENSTSPSVRRGGVTEKDLINQFTNVIIHC